MEKLPSIHLNRGEEDLRDFFVLYLEPRYEGSTTSETFNKEGSTDILIRYQGSNVFVAECKIWSGAKDYLEGLDQLLTYVAWRDTKTAMIIFVKDKGISHVLRDVRKFTPEHSNYVGQIDEVSDSWINYRFHINNDKNRELSLAVLIFHMPAG